MGKFDLFIFLFHESKKLYTCKRACAGEGFSLFWSNTGIVLSCGDNGKGCLGHGSLSTYLQPKMIEAFIGVKIIQVECGTQHVVALTNEGSIYTWGSNNYGALGLSRKITHKNSPQLIEFPIEFAVSIKKIHCKSDCSLILMDDGDVYACGRNTNNKLRFGKKVSHSYDFVST